MRFMTRAELGVFVVVLVGIVVGPVVADPFTVALMGHTATIAILALSVYIVLAWVGEIPLGHSLYFGIGAYGSAILMKDHGLGFLLATLSAMVIAAVLATLIGAITLRLRGAYFAIVSWGLASVAVVVVNSWDSLTGGALGYFGTPAAEIAGISFRDPQAYAWITGLTMVLAILGMAAVRRTPFGLRLNGGRINHNLIWATGANIYRDRVVAFAGSSALAALAGALSVTYVRVLTPSMFGFLTSVEALVMVLLGGTAFLLGPVVGAVIIRVVPEQFAMAVELRTVFMAGLILAIVLLVPGGIPDIVRRLSGLRRRRDGTDPGSPESTDSTRPEAEEVRS